MSVTGEQPGDLAPRRERFMALFWPHVDAMHAVAMRLTGRRDRAEECVQAALVRAWTYFDSFARESEPRPWLLTIVRRVVYDDTARRKRDLASSSLDAAALDPPAARGADPAGGILQEEVRRAIAEVPPDFRAVVELVVLDGLSYQETADALGIPIGTVMSRLYRGRRILRERLQAYAPEARADAGAPAAPAARSRREKDA